ncbi:MAG: TOBE domain-containing protein [Holophaga sp.]|nr:TOBE domain-containing protein [Holophaga sp.]
MFSDSQSGTPIKRCPARGLDVATITGLEPLGALTRVVLDAGFPLHALITTWAAQDLDLAAGQEVHALIKASAIQVVPIEDPSGA